MSSEYYKSSIFFLIGPMCLECRKNKAVLELGVLATGSGTGISREVPVPIGTGIPKFFGTGTDRYQYRTLPISTEISKIKYRFTYSQLSHFL